MNYRHFIHVATLIIVLCSLISGCGKSSGSVSGTAEFEGKPLPGGKVVLESGLDTCVALIADGKFVVLHKGSKNIPLGEYEVTVWPPRAVPTTNPKTMELEATYTVDLSLYPKKYRSKVTSGLTFTPVSGKNSYKIELNGD